MAESGHCAVLQGKAHASLLRTYEPERKAVALANTALSVTNWEQALKVPRALGLDPRAAALLQAAVSSGPASLLPKGTHKSIGSNIRLQQRGLKSRSYLLAGRKEGGNCRQGS